MIKKETPLPPDPHEGPKAVGCLILGIAFLILTYVLVEKFAQYLRP